MKFGKNIHRRIAATILGLLFIIPIGTTMQSRPAHAQLLTHDAFNYVVNSLTAASTGAGAVSGNALVVKGYVLDPLAWAVAKTVLNSVIQSTVRWINSGFNGSPSFITNLDGTLLTAANSAADSFITQLATNGSIKSPFQSQVASAVSTSYNSGTNGGFFTANAYNLNQTSSNPSAFLGGNIYQGGFNAWFSSIENPANNPYGAAALAAQGLNSQVASAQKNVTTEASWGNGFMSFKGNCNTPKTTTTGGTTSTSLSGTNTCANASIQTPGSVLANTTYKALGSGFDQLVTASQFGQIVNALVGQLTNAVLGTGGLSGVSQPSASGSSYLDQVSASQAASTESSAATFASTISKQITALQAFQSQWTIINNAALAAQTALTHSPCPTASTTQELSGVVQPALTQAATEISDAATSIPALQKIQSEANPSNSTTQIAQASSGLLNPPKLQHTSECH